MQARSALFFRGPVSAWALVFSNAPNLCSGALDLRQVQLIEPAEKLPKSVDLHDPLRCVFKERYCPMVEREGPGQISPTRFADTTYSKAL